MLGLWLLLPPNTPVAPVPRAGVDNVLEVVAVLVLFAPKAKPVAGVVVVEGAVVVVTPPPNIVFAPPPVVVVVAGVTVMPKEEGKVDVGLEEAAV